MSITVSLSLSTEKLVKRFDVDIDVASTFPLKIFESYVRASIYDEKNKRLQPHPCGIYFQEIPTDPITGLAAVPYETAEELGCFKMDFLHNKVYDHFTSKEEIKQLIKVDPDWTLLEIPSVVKQCYHIGNHYDLLKDVRPRSIIELADCLALIRPQKRFMLKAYLKNREKIRGELYSVDKDGGYAFKKAHALAYAYVIVLQLHLLKEGITL
jgi:hypothetical protein